MTIHVSVVVPTYRRPDLLNRCLQALFSQDYDPSTYEIIVADDAAEAGTQQLVESWAARSEAIAYVPIEEAWIPQEQLRSKEELFLKQELTLPETAPPTGTFVRLPGLPAIRYIAVQGNHGPSTARNQGWQAAHGEVIAFTDDDCIPDSEWLKHGVGAFRNGIDGVSGQVLVPLPENPTDYEFNTSGLVYSEFITANCFYRRSALAAVGGFDEAFTTAWREDSDLYFRILKKGFHLVHEPLAIVTHPVRPAAWGISIRQQRKSMFNALIYKKHPKLYRQKLQRNPPFHYYAIILSLLSAAFGLALGSNGTAVLALTTWFALTLRFSLRRLRHTSWAMSHILEMLFTSMLIPPLCVYWRLRGAIKYRVPFI